MTRKKVHLLRTSPSISLSGDTFCGRVVSTGCELHTTIWPKHATCEKCKKAQVEDDILEEEIDKLV